MSAREKIKVDKYKLEDEAANQAERFLQYSEKLPALYKKKRKAGDELKKIEAKIFIKIKKNYDDYFEDLDKVPSDAMVNKKVDTNLKVLKARKKLLDAEVAYLKESNRMTAFGQRKSMIQVMAQLYHDQYWAIDPSIDEEAVDIKFRKEVVKELNKKKKKKFKKITT